MRRALLGAYGALIVCNTLQAGLVWDKREFHALCSPAEEELTSRFAFTNTGPNTVTIGSVRTSCGCTVATLTNRIIRPGESGVVEAVFTLGHRTGVQRKPITVETDDPSQRKIGLYIVADIPEVIRAEPTYLLWREQDKPETKRVVVVAEKHLGVETIQARSLDPKLAVSVLATGTNDTYLVEVQPRTETGVIATVVQIEAVLATGHLKSTDVYVRVR